MKPALLRFLDVYGPAVKRMKLDLIFAKHVTILSRCGLVDARGGDAVWKKLLETRACLRPDLRNGFVYRKLMSAVVEKTSYEAAWYPARDKLEGNYLKEDHFGSRTLLDFSQEKTKLPSTTVRQLLGLPSADGPPSAGDPASYSEAGSSPLRRDGFRRMPVSDSSCMVTALDA